MLDDVEWKTFWIFAIALAFFAWALSSLSKDIWTEKPTVEKFTDVVPDDIEKVVNFVKNEIDNGKDNRNWNTYSVHKDSNYYRLYGKDDNKEPLYSARVDTDEGKKRYRVFKGINPVNTDAKELEINGSDHHGIHEGMSSEISVKHGRERMLVKLRNNQIIIRCLGGMSGSNSLPHPWYYGAPLVWTEGGRAIGLVDYTGDRRYAKQDMSYMPVEISLPDDEKDKLPLFLQAFAIIHENISKKNITP